MATAAMKGRAHAGANGGTVVASESVSMEFVIVEDNGGDYHWTLLDRDGNDLARSPSFVSYHDAEDAARVVLDGVGSARLDRRAAIDRSLDIPSKTKASRTAKNVDGAEGRFEEATGAHAATTA
jgi:uncharacterized protein YegP (UPF0339 family)